MNRQIEKEPWYRVKNIEEVSSPSVLIFPDRIESNIQKMISIAGGTKRLRPHVKTHKMPEIVRMQMKNGITKFKCATIAEAEMVADCGATDVLLAMQPVGPNLKRFFELRKAFPSVDLSCIADNEEVIDAISSMAVMNGMETGIWLDINVGMNRTGVIPSEATPLFRKIVSSQMLSARGLHVYDGHIHEPDFSRRKELCQEAFKPVKTLIAELEKDYQGKIKTVTGGTPSFPVHAQYRESELSPGTLLLWDFGYSSSFADMDFLHAAILLTRVVSKPTQGYICLDLGHKAVASEMPHPRVKILGMEKYEFAGHNEEHLVIRTPEASRMKIGDPVYCIPWHICPTMDRHDSATVIIDGKATAQWEIRARRRKLTY